MSPPAYNDDIDLKPHQVGNKLGTPLDLAIHVSVLEGDVLAFYMAALAQSRSNDLDAVGITSCIARRHIPYKSDLLRLLRMSNRTSCQQESC